MRRSKDQDMIVGEQKEAIGEVIEENIEATKNESLIMIYI